MPLHLDPNTPSGRPWRAATIKALKSSTKTRKILQAVFVVGASALAALAQWYSKTQVAPNDTVWTATSLILIGIAASVGILLAITEQGVSDVVEDNHNLEDQFIFAQDEIDLLIERVDESADDFDWLLALYNTARTARNLAATLVQQGICTDLDFRNSQKQILELLIAQKGLLVGQSDDYWNLSIYELNKDTRLLDCKVCRRRNRLDEDSDHRSWPVGKGHVGRAFDEERYVVVADTSDPDYRHHFPLPPDLRKAGDESKYRSMVSVPIRLGAEGAPLGILVATSDVAYCFYEKKPGETPIVRDPVEPLRAFASALALLYAPKSST